MWKIHSKYERDTSQGQIHHFLRSVPPAVLLDDYAGRIARKLWWTNPEFSLAGIIPSRFSMLIYHPEINNRPAGSRSSETYSPNRHDHH
jgi:hypothetical protein